MGRIQPYSPLHEPQKVVTQEDMWTTLARHVPEGSLKPPQATQSPKEKSVPLEWHKPVRTGERSGYVLTACGRYSITKDAHGEAVTYSAWKRLPDTIRDGRPYKEMPIPLGVFKIRADAEAICRIDAEQK
jgi:hypothetical protein